MKDIGYVLSNFFTHKDYLVPANQIPGTMYTPLHFAFEAVLILVIVGGALYIVKNKQYRKPVFTAIWAILAVWEIVIIVWDSTAGKRFGLDPTVNLSLYPCSIFLYTMPFVIWGKGIAKKIAYGYLCTLGMLGALINFLYPIARLTTYSCISFAGFHTFFFHGSMLFVYLVLILSGEHRYQNVQHWWELFVPCVASLIVSIPANIVNYSAIDADYMYFKGRFFVLAQLFSHLSEVQITCILYLLYIFVPACFYLPSYISGKLRKRRRLLETSV